MKELFYSTSFTLILLIFTTGCNPDVVEVDALSEYKYYTSSNPDNPLILRTVKPDGEVIQYYGEKDSEGVPTSINRFSFQKSTDAHPTQVQLNNEGRPIRINADNGEQYILEWESASKFRILASSPDGQYTVTVPIDLNSLRLPSYSTMNKQRQRKSLIATAEKLDGEVFPGPSVQSPTANLTLNVTKCSLPFSEGSVILTVKGNADLFPVTIGPTSSNNGSYLFNIPDPKEGILGNICTGIQNTLGHYCSYVDPSLSDPTTSAYICSSIGAAIDLILAGPTGEGVAIMASCEAVIGSLNIYCSTLGAGPAPGAPSIDQYLCNKIIDLEKLYKSDQYDITPTVYIPGEKTWANIINGENISITGISVLGPFPDINMNIPGEPTINTFHTTPFDPGEDEDYVASAFIYCADQTEATISVIGTDGYEDEIAVTIEGNSAIELSVPGAEMGVFDIVTIKLEDGTTSSIGIVF